MQKTTGKEFIQTPSSLLLMLQNLKGNRLFLHSSVNGFSISTVSRGISGCVGEMQVTRDEFLSSVHNQYYASLGSTFLNLFGILDDYISTFASNVHLLAMEGQPLPTGIADATQLIDELVDLIPTRLLNSEFPPGTFLLFEKLFSNSVYESNDDLIDRFRDREFLSGLRPRDLKQIYNAFKEFDNNVKFRLTRFFRYFCSQQYDRLIPKTLLFSRNQNPTTFSAIIRSMIPVVDDHILIDSFVIIQNCKSTLIKDLSRYMTKGAESRFINHKQLMLAKKGEADDILNFERFVSVPKKSITVNVRVKPSNSIQSDSNIDTSDFAKYLRTPEYSREVSSRSDNTQDHPFCTERNQETKILMILMIL